MTTIGKYRHLMQCSTPAGHFNILAIDHRGNLIESLQKLHAPDSYADAQFVEFKASILSHLAPTASAVLTDPDYGLGVGVARGHIRGQMGILAPVEVTDYTDHPSKRATNFIPNWSVEKIKRAGCSGVKLLLYYHPGAANAQQQREIVEQIVKDCTRYDIPFFLEPITYSLDPDQPIANNELRAVVIESAQTFSRMGIDVLKTEFPLDVKREPDETLWQAALKDLNAACTVPWALLSGGVDYVTFKRQVELACAAGASGVIAGRAIWGEAVTADYEAQHHFLSTGARSRMEELDHIIAQAAVSWQTKVAPLDEGPRWYTDY